MGKKAVVNQSIRKKILDFSDLLKKSGIKVDQIILYGSYAKGVSRNESDIDLCVVSSKFTQNTDHYFKKIWHLAARIDSSLEPIPFTLGELTNRYSTLSNEIKKHGIRII